MEGLFSRRPIPRSPRTMPHNRRIRISPGGTHANRDRGRRGRRRQHRHALEAPHGLFGRCRALRARRAHFLCKLRPSLLRGRRGRAHVPLCNERRSAAPHSGGRRARASRSALHRPREKVRDGQKPCDVRGLHRTLRRAGACDRGRTPHAARRRLQGERLPPVAPRRRRPTSRRGRREAQSHGRDRWRRRRGS